MDWRDETAYNRLIESLSPAGIAWEFLRRNPEYRQEWAAYKELEQRAFADLEVEQNSNRPTESFFAWIKELGVHKTSRRWFLAQWEDPDDSPLEPVFVFPHVRRRLIVPGPSPRGLVVYGAVKERPLYQFDLNLPVSPQVERVKQELLSMQERLRKDRDIRTAVKPRRDEFAIFLQVLDAQDASSVTIHDMLYPGETDEVSFVKHDRIYKKRVQAKRLMQTDYMHIAELGKKGDAL